MTGYDVYKKALLGTLYADNYTAEVTMDLMMDGQLLGTEKVYEEFSAEGDANLYRKVETSSNMEEGNSYSQETYFQDKTEIRIYQDPEDENINVLDNGKYYEPGSSRYFVGGFDVQNETDRKVVRFVELLADTFMGDLKNNFVYISGDADSKQYELALDGMQIPEFVNAGLSAIFSC